MNRIVIALVLAAAAIPAEANAAVNMRFACNGPSAQPSEPPQLPGSWDLLMDVGGAPSFGLLSVGRSGTALAGSVTMSAGVAVVRSLTLEGRTVTMTVTTGEGDVRFEGELAADGRRMCGIVHYHGGQRYEMVAQKRSDRRSARSE